MRPQHQVGAVARPSRRATHTELGARERALALALLAAQLPLALHPVVGIAALQGRRHAGALDQVQCVGGAHRARVEAACIGLPQTSARDRVKRRVAGQRTAALQQPLAFRCPQPPPRRGEADAQMHGHGLRRDRAHTCRPAHERARAGRGRGAAMSVSSDVVRSVLVLILVSSWAWCAASRDHRGPPCVVVFRGRDRASASARSRHCVGC